MMNNWKLEEAVRNMKIELDYIININNTKIYV